MNKIITPILLIPLFFLSFTNDDLLKRIVDQIEKYNANYPQEKAYVQLDKPYYAVKETIWYKIVVVEAATNLPDTVSIPVYVDLVEASSGKIVLSQIVKLDRGFGSGQIDIPETLNSENYTIVAYTNWMRNFDQQLFFKKDIKIFSTKNIAINQTFNAEEIDFQFFPEGGHLIENLDGRVAFKATDSNGLGLEVNGEIISSNGDTLCKLSTQHLGMGYFMLKAQTGLAYKAHIRYRNFSKIVDLPIAEKAGETFMVDNLTNNQKVKVIIGRTNPKPNTENAIIGQINGQVVFATKIDASKPLQIINIPKAELGSGMVQFTLFDENASPRAERLTFIEPAEKMQISIKTDKGSFQKREKTTLEINTRDENGKAIEGNFSVLVSDLNQIKEQKNRETLQSYLLLSSNVNGNIEAPSVYFDKEEKGRLFFLDLLLMTQGWRRFNWKDVMNTNLKEPKYLIENGLYVEGTITKKNNKAFGKPIDISLMVTTKDNDREYINGKTANNGDYLFTKLDFADSTQIMVQAKDGNDNLNANVTITQNTLPTYAITKSQGLSGLVDSEIENYLKLSTQTIDLKQRALKDSSTNLTEVVVKGRKIEKIKDNRTRMYDQPDASVVVKDLPGGGMNVIEYLRNRVPGLTVSGNPNNPTVIIRGSKSITQAGEPLYLLDGNTIPKEMTLSIDMNTVEKVDVLKSLASANKFGSQGVNGVISILTKKGNPNFDWTTTTTEGLSVVKKMGYAVAKQFYTPKYDVALPAHKFPDFRPTIYWEPNIKTDSSGTAKISFYNSDSEGPIQIKVEGISNKGIAGDSSLKYYINNK
jgi:hypothetical protein